MWNFSPKKTFGGEQQRFLGHGPNIPPRSDGSPCDGACGPRAPPWLHRMRKSIGSPQQEQPKQDAFGVDDAKFQLSLRFDGHNTEKGTYTY